ncbi:MAG: DUF4242 domain-containing protein [Chloroflexi bacterium]|nr:DUF4242 domain-containing protein [Chloroflexota bacterium]
MTFIDLHERVEGMTEDQLRGSIGPTNELGKALGVKLLRLYYNAGENRVFCLSEAPSKQAVLDVHAKEGLTCDGIWDVKTIE